MQDSSSKLQISNSAKLQLTELYEKSPEKRLRIEVLPGGCNGFEYSLKLDSDKQEDDLVLVLGSVEVVVDTTSLALIEGAVLDYESSLSGSRFFISNPNAVISCGCGNSFSI